VANGRYLHGEAIAIGLVAALQLSVEHAGLDVAIADEVTGALLRQGLPTIAEDIAPDAVLAAMRSDKKRVAGRTRFVLLEAPGQPVWGVELDDDAVAAAVDGACR
jgi:3-dehydroquinate synthase